MASARPSTCRSLSQMPSPQGEPLAPHVQPVIAKPILVLTTQPGSMLLLASCHVVDNDLACDSARHRCLAPACTSALINSLPYSRALSCWTC